MHVKSFLKQGKRTGTNTSSSSGANTTTNTTTEYVPLRQYYHRHTKSLFWEMEHIIPFGNSPLFRFILGWMLPLPVSLLKLTQTERLKKIFLENFVFQDMLVPFGRLDDILSFFHSNYTIYPIWLCPHRVYNTGPYQGFLSPSLPSVKDYEMFIDVGAYGPPQKPFNHLVDMPKMEKKVREVKGYQALYAFTYMSREEFRQMFHHALYDKLRKKFFAEDAFPEVYDKVCDRAVFGRR